MLYVSMCKVWWPAECLDGDVGCCNPDLDTETVICQFFRVLLSQFLYATIGKVPRLYHNHINLYPWPESTSELYRPSDRRLSAKLASTFADKGTT
jgi:hypothetical protein